MRGQRADGPIRPVVGGHDRVLRHVVVELDACLDPLGGVAGGGSQGEDEAGLVIEGRVGGCEGCRCGNQLGDKTLGVAGLGSWRGASVWQEEGEVGGEAHLWRRRGQEASSRGRCWALQPG